MITVFPFGVRLKRGRPASDPTRRNVVRETNRSFPLHQKRIEPGLAASAIFRDRSFESSPRRRDGPRTDNKKNASVDAVRSFRRPNRTTRTSKVVGEERPSDADLRDV